MAANILGDDVDPKKDFAWLDDISFDDCFMDMMQNDLSAPSKSLDFGKDGYTGSLTAWHELLQMTAPNPSRGLVYVRGDFPDDANSILARAQRRNPQGTWGLKPDIDDEDKLQLQGPDETGFINLRWPCAQFSLECDGYLDGIYTTCSFVKDGTLYQVIRIVPGKRITEPQDSTKPELQQLGNRKLKLVLGGRMIMKRPKTRDDLGPNDENAEYEKYYSEQTGALSFRSPSHDSSLALRLWVDRQQVELKPESLPEKLGTIDMTSTHEVELVEDTPKIIIATFSLFNSASDDDHQKIIHNGLPEFMQSSIAQDYMGVADSSKNAAYRLWKQILPRENDSYNGSSDFEVNTIGRSVEQILCVSSLPMIVSTAEEENVLISDGSGGEDRMGALTSQAVDEHPQIATTAAANAVLEEITGPENSTEGTPIVNINNPHKGVAFIKNIVSSRWVDLESTFWQIRLLIKAFNFFKANASKLPERDSDYFQPIREMGVLYKETLLRHIRLSCIWLLNSRPARFEEVLASIALGGEHDDNGYWNFNDLPVDHYFSTDGFCYHTITLWYTLRHCPEALKGSEIEALLRSRMIALEETPLPEAQDDPKTSLLRWYHCSYFLQKYKDSGGDVGDPSSPNHPANREKAWKVKATRSLKPGRKERSHGALEDAHIANLALLGEELFSNSMDVAGLPNKCLSYAKEFIQNRDYTTTLNPGRKDQKQANHTFQDTSPPWELISLNHHSLLRPEVGTSEDKFDTALEACQEFLLADYTFGGTWDGSDRLAISQWWDLLPTSIFAATLLDWRPHKHDEPSDSLWNGKQEKVMEGGQEVNGKNATPNKTAPAPGMLSRKPTTKKKDDSIDDLIKRLKDGFARAAKKQTEEDEEFDWISRKPPRVSFTDTFVQSLEDTPDLFRSKQLKNVKIRSNIEKYLERRNNNLPMPEPDWSLDTAAERIKAEELVYLSCYDISRASDKTSETQIFIRSREGGCYPHYGHELFRLLFDEVALLHNKERSTRSAEEGERRDLRMLWFSFLNGGADRHPKFGKLSTSLQSKLKDPVSRKDVLSRYQASLFSLLNDSFVDLGTQFRILFVQRYSPIVIQAFIYMWHTDALDAFDDHLGTVSRFFNGRTSSGSTDVWITSITVLHWNLEYNDDFIPTVFDEARGEKAWFPPLGVAGVHKGVFRKMLWFWPTQERDSTNLDIGETASTLVITGDEKGFSWTCSIISSILDKGIIALYAEAATDTLEMFNHQQYSGRSLVFIMFLGYICESLASKNDHFLHTLDTVMDMDQKALLKGIEWQKSQLALRRLKTMLWSMEALRIFDDKLLGALTEINEARSNLMQELDKEDYLRPKALKRHKANVLEEFDKRYTRLKDSHTSILQLIEQSSRLREGITSVLGVEQNENIAMLTYITIAYLPLGFIAAIFSTHIMPDSVGLTTFGWLIAIFLVGTFIFALSLQTILGATRRFWKAVDQKTSKWEKSFASSAVKVERPGSTSSRYTSSNRNTQPGVYQKDDLESGTRIPA